MELFRDNVGEREDHIQVRFNVIVEAHCDALQRRWIEGLHGQNILQLDVDWFCYVLAHNQFTYKWDLFSVVLAHTSHWCCAGCEVCEAICKNMGRMWRQLKKYSTLHHVPAQTVWDVFELDRSVPGCKNNVPTLTVKQEPADWTLPTVQYSSAHTR